MAHGSQKTSYPINHTCPGLHLYVVGSTNEETQRPSLTRKSQTCSVHTESTVVPEKFLEEKLWAQSSMCSSDSGPCPLARVRGT